jgi:hypothetical protein
VKDILFQLAQLVGQTSTSFGAFDPSPLLGGRRYDFSPVVSEYFQTSVPSVKLNLDLYRIFSPADIASENQGNIPSYFCAPHGFITIATELSGDAFSVDVTDGRVYHLSHEKYETDGIHPVGTATSLHFSPLFLSRARTSSTRLKAIGRASPIFCGNA